MATDAANRTLRPLALVLAVLLLRTVVLAGAAALLQPAGGRMLLGVVVVALDVATLLVLSRLLRRVGWSLRALLGRPLLRYDIPVAGLVALALFVATVSGSAFAEGMVHEGAPPDPVGAEVPLWLGLWSLLVMPVTAAFAEELLYLGWALDQLAARWRPWIVVVTTALAFGFQYAALGIPSAEDAVVWAVAALFAGAVIAILRIRGVRLWAFVIGHWAFAVLGLGIPALRAALA